MGITHLPIQVHPTVMDCPGKGQFGHFAHSIPKNYLKKYSPEDFPLAKLYSIVYTVQFYIISYEVFENLKPFL